MRLTSTLPKYILSKKQLSFSFLLTTLFSILASMILTICYNGWFQINPSYAAILTLIFWALCFIIVISSRLILHHYRYMDITILGYSLWMLAELILITLVYTVMTYIGNRIGWIYDPIKNFGIHFANCLSFCLFGLGIPNVLSILWCAISERDQVIRLMNFKDVVSDKLTAQPDDKKILLYDNSGNLKLSVNQENLFYIKSDDNYVKVWFQDEQSTLKQFMLRCKLKTIEESFSDSDLVRCHRKYIVNINKIERLTHQKDGSYSLELGHDIGTIPVSKTYEKKVIERYNSR